MRLFKKDAGKTVGAEDVRAVQDTVTAITAALKSGADQQDIATKRLSALTKSMEKMEASVRHTTRLEADAQRQSIELKEAKADLEKKRAWAQEQTAKLATVQKERDTLRTQIEDSKLKLAQLTERETSARETETRQRREIETLNRELSQRTERLEDLALTQNRLQDELSQTSTELSAKSHKTRELENAVEELTARLSEKTQTADASMAALRDLRLDYNAAKEKLVTATARLQSAEYDQTSQKQMTEETLKRRADEILALKTQIEQLSTQLRIKDKMGAHFDEEVSGLRQSLEAERERNATHEQRLRHQAETESKQTRAMAHAKSEYDALSAKFQDAMADLDALRQVNRVQAQKLERYAELNKMPAPKRSYGATAPAAPTPAPRPDKPTVLNVVK